MERHFRAMLEARWAAGYFVCVGLDSEFEKIPESVRNECGGSVLSSIVEFNRAIVNATYNLVCAYKPNIAFYAAHGDEGLAALRRTVIDIHGLAPDVPVILDAKRADIGNTNNGYVAEAFDFLGADAITVNPYLGGEALTPFLERKEKGIFVLCRTSNPGSNEFQALSIADTMPLYRAVAIRVASPKTWNKNGNCGLVVGATYPSKLREVRELVGDMPILIPGIGAQGGDVEQTVKAAGGNHMIINSSRGIIFASKGADYADAARRETIKLRDLINQYRESAKEVAS